MHVVALAALLAAQAGSGQQGETEDIGRDAAQCMAFYRAAEKYVARTDQERAVPQQLQRFMLVFGHRSGISVESFEQVRASREAELEGHVRQNDRVFLDAEKDRCNTFAKRQAERLQAEAAVGG